MAAILAASDVFDMILSSSKSQSGWVSCLTCHILLRESYTRVLLTNFFSNTYMPYSCPSCKVDVKCVDSICCDKCNKWHHLKCTELSVSDFEIYTLQKCFEWFCDSCKNDYCNKCEIFFFLYSV